MYAVLYSQPFAQRPLASIFIDTVGAVACAVGLVSFPLKGLEPCP